MQSKLDIDFKTEELLPLSAVGSMLPGSRGSTHVSPVTVYRWSTIGSRTIDGRRVRLETIRVGSRRLTSRQAVERFISELTCTSDVQQSTQSPTKRRADDHAAQRSLRNRGIKTAGD